MNYLVGDIGNTLTKITLLDSNFKITKSFQIETSKLNNNREKHLFFKRILKKKANPTILISSVVPNIFRIIKSYLKKLKIKTIEIKELNIRKMIKLNIKKISELGSDRIANAIGAFFNYNKNCIIIDFGTATTFDIIKQKGIYEGGVIAPGIKNSISALNNSTALLPIIKLKKNPKTYGKNTIDALNAGFIWGYQGLINNIIKKISFNTKKKYKVILTGGYADIFSDNLLVKPFIDKDITIKGIAKIYKDLLL